jgi:hypothetical protein
MLLHFPTRGIGHRSKKTASTYRRLDLDLGKSLRDLEKDG